MSLRPKITDTRTNNMEQQVHKMKGAKPNPAGCKMDGKFI